MPPPSAPTAAPPSAPMPASFAAFKILSFLVFSGPPWAAATRLHSATTDCGGAPLRESGGDVDGAGAGVVGWAAGGGVVGAWATCGFTVVEGDADGAATLVSLVPVRFATTIPVTTATMAAIASPIAVIFHISRLSSAMARFLLRRAKPTTCQRLRLTLTHPRATARRRRETARRAPGPPPCARPAPSTPPRACAASARGAAGPRSTLRHGGPRPRRPTAPRPPPWCAPPPARHPGPWRPPRRGRLPPPIPFRPPRRGPPSRPRPRPKA